MTPLMSFAKLLKWLAVVVLLVLVSIVIAVVWIYYANTIKETPTCISFMASGSLDARAKVFAALPGVAESAGMKLKAADGESKFWRSNLVTVSLYSSRHSGDYFVFVCQNQHPEAQWQNVAKQVEQLLQGSLYEASLQRNDRYFNCNPNCVISLSIPINFDLLNQTMLAHDPGS